MTIQNFNSIKVRLEQTTVLTPVVISSFQFHKGTIRTAVNRLMYDNVFRFQFHKGTIRTARATDQFSSESLFQFHKGTIRTAQAS